MSNKKFLLIVAGGSGLRMGVEIPKQFLEVAGKPILMHTMLAFSNFNMEKTVLCLPPDYMEFWKELCKKYAFEFPHELVAGGAERFFSVKNGLSVLPEIGLVAVHDGVRPLVSEQTIKGCFETAMHYKAAIPVIGLSESIRKVDATGSIALNRTEYRLVQTPQVFDIQLLKQAYSRPFSEFFTDDASVVEALGHKVEICDGNEENIKITRKHDLQLANALLQNNRL